MKQAVMISIHPKWCDVIAHGKKTIEIRKTKPTLEVPFKVYLYCTKPKRNSEDFFVFDSGTDKMRYFYGGGKVIGEFVCDWCEYLDVDSVGAGWWNREHFKYEDYFIDSVNDELMLEKSCITRKELIIYNNGKRVYGWHISDLKMYDKPKELSDFSLTKPPQSWCYVKETEK